MKSHQIWHEQCAAAREIQEEFGTDSSIKYLVGEKFINFVSAAETDEAFPSRPYAWSQHACGRRR